MGRKQWTAEAVATGTAFVPKEYKFGAGAGAQVVEDREQFRSLVRDAWLLARVGGLARVEPAGKSTCKRRRDGMEQRLSLGAEPAQQKEQT